jgi:hypothetical protein
MSLKATGTIFGTNYLHYIHRNFILCHPLYFLYGQIGDHHVKPVSAFLTGEGGKLAGLPGTVLSQWQPLVKLFSPGSRPHATKIWHEHTGYQ